MYYYHKDLAPLINDPELYREEILEILKDADQSTRQIKGYESILNNPFNGALRFYNIGSLYTTSANAMWAAACLMIEIPSLRSKENIAASLEYLRLATTYNFPFAHSKLGWCYSQGVEGFIEINYEKAITHFENCRGKAMSHNTLGYCYEQMKNFPMAIHEYKLTLESHADNEPALRHLKECFEKLTEQTNVELADKNKEINTLKRRLESYQKELQTLQQVGVFKDKAPVQAHAELNDHQLKKKAKL